MNESKFPSLPVSTEKDKEEGKSKQVYKLSLLEAFREELFSTEEPTQPIYKIKRERVHNFFQLPKFLEPLMLFGYFVCVNEFLYCFTMLPIRFILAFYKTTWNVLVNRRFYYSCSNICDLSRGLIIITCCLVLLYVDPSQLYHSVRGQSIIKLYVIYNLLEIVDKLLSSFGHDVMDSLFSVIYIKCKKHNDSITDSVSNFRVSILFMTSCIYTIVHSMLMYYQLVSLNVAINSYNDALLSLLLSNQFGEIKSSVFRRYDPENLFQVTCSDIVERFQISIYLSIITIRNLFELYGSLLQYANDVVGVKLVLPTSYFEIIPKGFIGLYHVLLTPAALVFVCEIFVDLLKHAFITKFNHIRPPIYDYFAYVLCLDIIDAKNGSKKSHRKLNYNHSSLIKRRLGLCVIPLVSLTIRMTCKIFSSNNIINDNFEFFSLSNVYKLLKVDIKNSKNVQNTFIYISMIILIYIGITIIKVLLNITLYHYALKKTNKPDSKSKYTNNDYYKNKSVELDNIKNNIAQNNVDKFIYKEKEIDLSNIDRYTLYRSRIS